MMKLLWPFTVAASIAFAGAVGAQRPTNFPGGRGGASNAAAEPAEEGVPAVEHISTTHHTVTINGKSIPYTANAGTMVVRDDNGKPVGTVFYISYTKDQTESSARPVTFFFNGGPGSASIWLDMGLMAPRHPEMGPNGAQPAPPYTLVDNPYSPLDATDLVQIDAMMTGYSRPGPGVKVTDFTGATNDIKMFA